MRKLDLRKEINELKENPGRIFGVVYIYILVIGLLFGIHYVNNISAVTRQAIPPAVPDTTAQADLKVIEARSIPPVDLQRVSAPDQQMLESGQSLYNTVCASCHGEDGAGKGPAGAGLNPPPRNFTSSSGWKNGQILSGIYKTLEEGIPGTAMIPYDYMPPSDKIALAHYIRNTFVPNAPKVTPEEVTTLEQTYNLSKGGEVAAQIPVTKAMDIYLRDKKTTTDNIIRVMREISSSGNEGAQLFNRIVSDRAEAVSALAVNNEWINDKNKFKSLVTAGSNGSGFNSEAYYLDENEWNLLHNYLVSFF